MRVAWIILITGCGFRSQPGVLDDTAPAAAPDASVPYTCPTSYSANLPGPSHYRLIVEGHPAWIQSDTCAGDLPGKTHLVVLETQDEISEVAALVSAPPMGIAGNAIWVGGVQQRTAVLPGTNWLRFDGEPLTLGWGGAEPNDKGNGELDHEEQFVRLEKGKAYLQDSAGNGNYGALCECDGKPLAMAATMAIDSNHQ
jgi:hypothetical protein